MITISRVLARHVRAVFRRALGLAARRPLPPVALVAAGDGLRLRCMNNTAAAEYHASGRQPPETILAPFDLLAACEGGRDEPVTLEAEGQNVVARWSERGVPQSRRFDIPIAPSAPFPECPSGMARNPPGLLKALHDAAETADQAASRYALGCVQLRGRQGVIAATDSRQLLVQGGFRFDWDGDLLVPRNPLFGSKELPQDEPVYVARNNDCLTLRVGRWTFHLALEKEGRFPRVEDIIARPDAARATLTLSEADAGFLARTINRLPANEEMNNPVTVDLNGSLAVRAKGAADPHPAELVLAGSRRAGEPVVFNTDRRYLERAVRLGFRTLHVFEPQSAVQCRDGRRTYVWMPLTAEGAIGPSPDAVRITSAAGGPPPAASIPMTPTAPERNHPTVTRTPTGNGNGHQAASSNGHSPDRGGEGDDLIVRAEAVRDSLRESLAGVTALIAGLKLHRRQTKLVRSTLASLRQLQSLGSKAG